MSTAVGVLAFVVLILFAIFFHEFGHFITARWANIKVTRFFVGFGPTIWSCRRGRPETVMGKDGVPTTRPETEYGVKALPLGGFVKIVGMSPFEDVPAEDEPRSFDAAPTWKRAIVLAAGSATHFVTAFVILFLIFTAVGIPDPDRVTLEVSAVEPEIAGETSPAARAGLEPGDRIVAIGGARIDGWEDVRTAVRASPADPLELTVVRGGERLSLTVTPRAEQERGETIGVIGVHPHRELMRLGPVAAAGRSGQAIGELLGALVDVAPRAFSPDSLGLGGGGPTNERLVSIVGAGRIAADLVAEGELAIFLFLFVQINVFIAIFNMVPLPPLDGGHLLMLGVEKVRGKPVSPRAILPVTAVVFSLLILLAMLLFYYDIVAPVRLPTP